MPMISCGPARQVLLMLGVVLTAMYMCGCHADDLMDGANVKDSEAFKAQADAATLVNATERGEPDPFSEGIPATLSESAQACGDDLQCLRNVRKVDRRAEFVIVRTEEFLKALLNMPLDVKTIQLMDGLVKQGMPSKKYQIEEFSRWLLGIDETISLFFEVVNELAFCITHNVPEPPVVLLCLRFSCCHSSLAYSPSDVAAYSLSPLS